MNKMYWGFSGKSASLDHVLGCVGKGWHPLVCKLIDDLFELGWDGYLDQIKEKFGGLRFYINDGTDAMWKRIGETERESCSTCEVCGNPGKLRQGGWIRCLCDEHAEGRDALHI